MELQWQLEKSASSFLDGAAAFLYEKECLYVQMVFLAEAALRGDSSGFRFYSLKDKLSCKGVAILSPNGVLDCSEIPLAQVQRLLPLLNPEPSKIIGRQLTPDN